MWRRLYFQDWAINYVHYGEHYLGTHNQTKYLIMEFLTIVNFFVDTLNNTEVNRLKIWIIYYCPYVVSLQFFCFLPVIVLITVAFMLRIFSSLLVYFIFSEFTIYKLNYNELLSYKYMFIVSSSSNTIIFIIFLYLICVSV